MIQQDFGCACKKLREEKGLSQEKLSEYKDPEKRKLQCYMMDDYERANVENTLFYMLEYLDPEEDNELVGKVMSILFWFQGERLVTDLDQQPEVCVENPVSILTTEVTRMYVLSAGVSYNLKKIASVFSYALVFDEEDEPYFGILTNVVNGMSILNAWGIEDDEERKNALEALAFHLRKRLFIEYEIIKTMQRDNNDGKINLSTWPMQYRMINRCLNRQQKIERRFVPKKKPLFEMAC